MTTAASEAVLVVAPLREELRGLRLRLEEARRVRRTGTPVWQGRIGSVAVYLAVVGDGASRSAACLDRLLGGGDPPVRALLVVGVAGGLDASLSACEVLAPAALGTLEASAPPPDGAWLGRLPASLRRDGALVSVERVAAGTAAKRALAARAGPSALAVDLESAGLAAVAARHGVPFVVLRSVSDTLEESLPRFLEGCLRPDGSISRGRVLAALLLRPRRGRALRAIARRMRACAEALADAATLALEQAPRR